jgi:hypothetical protein
MKFIALLKKELRESIVPIILALIVFGGFTALEIRHFVDRGGDDYQGHVRMAKSGAVYGLFHHIPLNDMGGLLLFASLMLGLTLGALHFGMPQLTRTWSFLLHRPVPLSAILGSKLLAVLIALALSLGLPWTWAILRIQQVKTTGFPGNPQVYWEGWLFIGLGLALYLGTALCAMSNAHWYTTRLIGPAFASLCIILVFTEISISLAFAVLGIAVVILLLMLISTCLDKGSTA